MKHVQMLTAQVNRRKVMLILVLVLTGCQSPFLIFPGGELNGTVSSSETFAFAENHTLIMLEVRPEAPYSVILRCVVIEGDLYLDAAPARKWGQMIEADSRVRIKLGSNIYPATAVAVTDQSITGRFLPGRNIYRLVPGWSTPPALQQ